MASNSDIRAFSLVMTLALVCSLLVAGAAVGLRSRQEANKDLDRRKNILRAAGIYNPKIEVAEQFKRIDTRVVDLASGDFVGPDKVDPQVYDQLRAARTADGGRQLGKDVDRAGLGRLEKYSLVYLLKKDGGIERIILPVRGKGLWSTMYAYVALAADGDTIKGVTFYEHGETPGLGGEVENPAWQAGWRGKKIYAGGRPALRLLKGRVDDKKPGASNQIDGLSGATLTSKGVSNLLQFWFGDHGFGPFLKKIKKGGGDGGQ